MTCTPLTDRQFLLLAALTGGPRPALDFDWDEVEVLRHWGWVFGRERIELTGPGTTK